MNVKKIPKNVHWNLVSGLVGDTNKLPETVLTINSRQHLYNFSYQFYKVNGFYIGYVDDASDRKQIDILQDYLAIENFSSRDSCVPVFNTFPSYDKRLKQLKAKRFVNSRIDRGRNMIHISCTKEKLLKQQSLKVGALLQRKIAKDLHWSSSITSTCSENFHDQMVLTLLETEASVKDHNGFDVFVPDQLMHCDVDCNDATLNNDGSFIGILATQMGFTELRVLKGSHLINHSTYKTPESIKRILIPQYYYFVGHPFLIHGGCGSLLRNTRFHFYHGLSEESQSRTYFPQWELQSVAERLKTASVAASKAATAKRNKKRKLGLL